MAGPKLERAHGVDLNGAGTPIALGDQTYTIVPQKIGRLRSRLGVELKSLESLSSALEGTSFDAVIGTSLERAHGLLSVFIPDLMPVHEFCGFSTQEAYEADEYHEASDHGPDLTQVRVAFDVCMKVNSLDLLAHLKNVFGPELIRAVVQEQVLTRVQGALTEATEESSLTPSSTSTSSTSGPESESTTSGMTPPTSDQSAG